MFTVFYITIHFFRFFLYLFVLTKFVQNVSRETLIQSDDKIIYIFNSKSFLAIISEHFFLANFILRFYSTRFL